MFSEQNRINFEINNLERLTNIWKLRHFQLMSQIKNKEEKQTIS